MRVSVDSGYRNTNMWYVDGAVAVLKLLLTLVGLPQQLLGRWKLASFSDVTDSRLEQVMIPNGLLL